MGTGRPRKEFEIDPDMTLREIMVKYKVSASTVCAREKEQGIKAKRKTNRIEEIVLNPNMSVKEQAELYHVSDETIRRRKKEEDKDKRKKKMSLEKKKHMLRQIRDCIKAQEYWGAIEKVEQMLSRKGVEEETKHRLRALRQQISRVLGARTIDEKTRLALDIDIENCL